jgi:cytochrome c oxidase cbb3-type subunit 3/ubiquinol-cytochrome c reductase cytochrome c subunit
VLSLPASLLRTRKRPRICPAAAALTILVALVLSASGCDFPGEQSAQIRPVSPDQVVSFDALYATNCAGCHGADGTLGPAPPLNDPLFLRIVPDAVLHDVIRDGRPGTLMPAFIEQKGGTLTEAQVRVLADGLKTHWHPAPASPGEKNVPAYLVPAKGKGEPSTATIARGAKVYERACAGCHGANGKGGDAAGAIADPAFLALLSDQALRRIVITGRTDLDMPDYAHTDGRSEDFQPLTSAEIDDLVVYLRNLEKNPPATAQLDRDPQSGSPVAVADRTDKTP